MKTFADFEKTNNFDRLKTVDEELYHIISNSFKMLYELDDYLIDNSPYNKNSTVNTNSEIGGLHHVGERAIVFRFAYYLQKQLEESTYSDYIVDCEYNRNGEKAKILNEERQKGVYPDIIIHKRNSNDFNLLVIEFKTYWNDNIEDDVKKINQLIDSSGVYRYKYGMSVIIKEDHAQIKTIDYK